MGERKVYSMLKSLATSVRAPDYNEAMPVFCTNCGTQVPDGVGFCQACGKPLPRGPEVVGGTPPPSASSAGLSDHAAAALAYITFIPAIIFLMIEPYNHNRFVRFHAWQCIFLCLARIVLGVLFAMPLGLGHLILLPIQLSIGLIFFVLWLLAIINAAQGKWFHLPIIGEMAEAQANKG